MSHDPHGFHTGRSLPSHVIGTPASDWPSRIWFGLHYDLHATARDTELGKDVTPGMLREAWTLIQPDLVQCDCKGHPGWTSWPTRVGSASPGIIRDALRVHRDVTRELGIPLVMHYSGVWDARALELHPDWAQREPDGSAGRDINGPGCACYTCPLSGYVNELMIPQLLELIDTYEVDGFWVDGDCWAARPCYCDRCVGRFTRQTGFSGAPKSAAEPGWREWLAFGRSLWFERTRRCVEAVHARNPDCKYCGNWAFTARMPDAVCLPVDFLSGDFFHKWAVEDVAIETRCIQSHGLPWNLMAWAFSTGEDGFTGWTTKSQAALCQEAAAVLAQGGGCLLYEHPPRSGVLVDWRHARFAEVARFCRERQAHCQHTTAVPQVALLQSADHYYENNSPLFNPGNALLPIQGALLALLETGHSVEIFNEQRLLERLSSYPMVVIAEQRRPSETLRRALSEYVARGGRLVLAGTEVAVDFAELCGVAAGGIVPDESAFLPVDGEAVRATGPWQAVSGRDAHAACPLLSGPDLKRHLLAAPAATLRTLGRGRVLAIHGPLFSYYQRTHSPRLRDVLRQLVRQLEPDLAVRLDAPPRIELSLRQRGSNWFVNLLNRGSDHPLSARNVMVENVPAIPAVRVSVKLAGAPRAVLLQPGDRPVAWSWQDNWLHVGPFELGIHDIVAITQTT